MVQFRVICTSLAFISAAFGSPFVSLTKRETEDVPENAVNQDTLRQVTVLMRHGERAPVDTYPNDPNINSTMAPYGWGQLTKKGRVNVYNQGTFLRNRYDKFLGKTYNPDVFWLQSSSADRTKMTAMILSSALWKPDEEQSFNSDIPWQPTVLHYWTRPDDKLLIIWNACPRYTMERMMLENSTELQSINEENQELYAELSEKTGTKFHSPGNVGDLYATIRSETTMDAPVPEWTQKYYPDRLYNLTVYSLSMNAHNDVLKRLAGGPFVKKALGTMKAKSKGTLRPESRKMYAYVAHDSTLVNVLSALGVWDHQDPDYNCLLMIELHENNGSWNVQMFQRSSPEKKPVPLTIPGCVHACPLEEFEKLVKSVVPVDYTEECKVSDPNYVVPNAPPA